jgi:hypothetical protein
LGARLDGIEEVTGSNPVGSTKSTPSDIFLPTSATVKSIRSTAVALLLSAGGRLVLGIGFYSFPQRVGWGADSPEFRVLEALRLGFVVAAGLFLFLFAKNQRREK